MWVGLALGALFGLLFGWAFRGISLKSKARDAMVQRDIALTELDQTRLELDHLYAAQSKGVDSAAQAGDETLRLELEAREEKLQVLSKELAASQGELDALKSKAALGAAAGAAIATGAVIAGQENKAAPNMPEERLDAELNLNDASLEWRNRYLASRVRVLEANSGDHPDAVTETGLNEAQEDPRLAALEEAEQRASDAEAKLETVMANAEDDKKQAIAAALAASAVTGAAGVALSAGLNDAHPEDTAEADPLAGVKQAWQNNYLRQRLSAAQSALPSGSEPVDDSAEPSSMVAHSHEADVAPTDKTDVQSEIQAWKTQNLQHRLAYLEEYPLRARESLTTGQGADEAVQDHRSEQDPEAASEAHDEAASFDEREDTPSAGDVEQELARLRWRNRYLEGRLAYIDGDAPKTDAEIAAQSLPGVETVMPETVEEAGLNPAEAVLAAMEGNLAEIEGDEAKPIALDKPDNDGDDLTRIEGIDAQTARMLNEAGVWHYYQIAGWSPENIDWVNTLLGDGARIQEQDWIAQAGALSLGADSI